MAKTWRWNGSDWAQIGSAFLVNQDNTTSDTSQHSAISYDGNILAIGGNRENHTYTTEGEVTVYEYDSTNNTWTEMSGSPLTQPTSTAANDYFGNSVGINGDGTILAIAAAHSDRRGSSRGDIFVFKYINNTWTFFQYLDFGEYSLVSFITPARIFIEKIMNAHNKMFKPPALHASSTGGAETNTAAKPPSAVYPIIPKLINPAYPH